MKSSNSIFSVLLITFISFFHPILTVAQNSLQRVDNSTLTGKIMSGYQGWFTCEGDDADRGWFHYGKRGEFKPGQCTIDLWPDMSEMDEDEKYATAFKHADGSTAHVFSSMNKKTVLRHFKWMQEYGHDGVFVQRFAVQTFNPSALNLCNTVLNHCREGANQYGRVYTLMYDLSGLRSNQLDDVIADFKSLVDDKKLTNDTNDKSYLHHNGKPVVAVWGIGFNDNRRYTLEDCAKLVDFLQNDPVYGGNTVMIGIPTYWRTMTRDTLDDPLLHDIIKKADIISPWTIGRYSNPEQIERYVNETLTPDIAWCKENNVDYLPVAFPGFSWHNMNQHSPLNQIPRLGGKFLWKQYYEYQNAGATMIYQAMFDEVDEGTAIFKCTNNPPTGESPFLTYEGLPSDHYLWLAGKGIEMLNKKIPIGLELPLRD